MASKRNKYLDRICEFAGVADPGCAIQALVGRYQESGRGLRSIATSLGVTRIVEEPMLIDGAVVVDGQHRLTIKVNSRCGPERRKFTLAHEVAHLVLSEVVSERALCKRVKALEDACDAIAAELLMPTGETTRFVQAQGSPSPEKLRAIAGAFAVSLRTAALRIHKDLRLWKEKVGLWRYELNARELWFVGKRPWRTPNPPFAAFERAISSSTAIRSRESYFEDNEMRPVSLEVLNIGSNLLLGLVG